MLASLPNLLTLARVAAVPVIVALMFIPGDVARFAATVVFALAALTDYLDGWLARSSGQVSEFGRFLDPIADKVVVIAALVMLVADGTLGGVHVIPVLVIVLREILVSGLREFLAEDKVTVPVTFLAKVKTTLQLAAIVALMLSAATGTTVHVLGLVLIWAAAAATGVTGGDYLSRGLRHVIAKDRATAGRQPPGPR